MATAAVTVEELSKRYALGASGGGYRRLTESLSRVRSRSTRSDEVWALSGVSLTIESGETVGLIGRNGAGKSTLLKVLARVTAPSRGRATLCGRVGSLLEVGTGFHPELTGRENVFLSGAILGMRNREIRRRFDDIVEFAEIAKFLDTPVKRYSSGMYVRLAFSVAAHLEPDILLVDEVLAVGDAAFQRKCLGRMGEAAGEGRTVIFVSHNMTTIETLCRRSVLLADGQVVEDGSSSDVIRSYLEGIESEPAADLGSRRDRSGDGSAVLVSVKAEAVGGGAIRCGSRVRISLGYHSATPLRAPQFLVGMYDVTNVGLFLLDSDVHGGTGELPADGVVVCETGALLATPGRVYLNVALNLGGGLADYVTQAAVIDIEPDDPFGLGKVPGRDWVMGVVDQHWRGQGTDDDAA